METKKKLRDRLSLIENENRLMKRVLKDIRDTKDHNPEKNHRVTYNTQHLRELARRALIKVGDAKDAKH